MKKVQNHIKERIAELIKPRGLKAKLAKKLGFERGSISSMLTKPGDPGIHYIQAVSEITGKSIEWILTGEETEIGASKEEHLRDLEARGVSYNEMLKQKNENIELYKELLKCKDEIAKLKSEIDEQRITIAALQSIERSQEEQIKMLKEPLMKLERKVLGELEHKKKK